MWSTLTRERTAIAMWRYCAPCGDLLHYQRKCKYTDIPRARLATQSDSRRADADDVEPVTCRRVVSTYVVKRRLADMAIAINRGGFGASARFVLLPSASSKCHREKLSVACQERKLLSSVVRKAQVVHPPEKIAHRV